MKEVQGQRAKVKIPTTAEEWELFADMNGATKAAETITKEVGEAIELCSPYRAAVKVSAVLRRFSMLGASDTEPRYHANKALSEAFGIEDALYLSKPVAAAVVPGMKRLKAHLAESKAKWERLNDEWDQSDASQRDEAKELTGYVAGLEFAIKTLEEA
jgi:hypothetical protein